MSAIETFTVNLPVELVAFVDRLIARGEYASFSEAVSAGLDLLQKPAAED